VRLAAFMMERGVPDYRLLAGRARNKERISWRFNRYYPIVPVLAGLIVAVGPPVSVLVWCEKAVVVTLFVGSVKMCSIGTRKQLRQFETR
jgi:C4-dicarboxylate transporter